MSREDHPSRRRGPKPLMLISDRDGTVMIAPLLTCGHYGSPIYGKAETWDQPDEAFKCPKCGQERQMTLELQYKLMSGLEIVWSDQDD